MDRDQILNAPPKKPTEPTVHPADAKLQDLDLQISEQASMAGLDEEEENVEDMMDAEPQVAEEENVEDLMDEAPATDVAPPTPEEKTQREAFTNLERLIQIRKDATQLTEQDIADRHELFIRNNTTMYAAGKAASTLLFGGLGFLAWDVVAKQGLNFISAFEPENIQKYNVMEQYKVRATHSEEVNKRSQSSVLNDYEAYDVVDSVDAFAEGFLLSSSVASDSELSRALPEGMSIDVNTGSMKWTRAAGSFSGAIANFVSIGKALSFVGGGLSKSTSLAKYVKPVMTIGKNGKKTVVSVMSATKYGAPAVKYAGKIYEFTPGFAKSLAIQHTCNSFNNSYGNEGDDFGNSLATALEDGIKDYSITASTWGPLAGAIGYGVYGTRAVRGMKALRLSNNLSRMTRLGKAKELALHFGGKAIVGGTVGGVEELAHVTASGGGYNLQNVAQSSLMGMGFGLVGAHDEVLLRGMGLRTGGFLKSEVVAGKTYIPVEVQRVMEGTIKNGFGNWKEIKSFQDQIVLGMRLENQYLANKLRYALSREGQFGLKVLERTPGAVSQGSLSSTSPMSISGDIPFYSPYVEFVGMNMNASVNSMFNFEIAMRTNKPFIKHADKATRAKGKQRSLDMKAYWEESKESSDLKILDDIMKYERANPTKELRELAAKHTALNTPAGREIEGITRKYAGGDTSYIKRELFYEGTPGEAIVKSYLEYDDEVEHLLREAEFRVIRRNKGELATVKLAENDAKIDFFFSAMDDKNVPKMRETMRSLEVKADDMINYRKYVAFVRQDLFNASAKIELSIGKAYKARYGKDMPPMEPALMNQIITDMVDINMDMHGRSLLTRFSGKYTIEASPELHALTGPNTMPSARLAEYRNIYITQGGEKVDDLVTFLAELPKKEFDVIADGVKTEIDRLLELGFTLEQTKVYLSLPTVVVKEQFLKEIAGGAFDAATGK